MGPSTPPPRSTRTPSPPWAPRRGQSPRRQPDLDLPANLPVEIRQPRRFDLAIRTYEMSIRPATPTPLDGDRPSKLPRLRRGRTGSWVRGDQDDINVRSTLRPAEIQLPTPPPSTKKAQRTFMEEDQSEAEQEIGSSKVHPLIYLKDLKQSPTPAKPKEPDDYDMKDPNDSCMPTKREVDEGWARIRATDWTQKGAYTSLETLEDMKLNGYSSTPKTKKRRYKKVATLDEKKATPIKRYNEDFVVLDDGSGIMDAMPSMARYYPLDCPRPWGELHTRLGGIPLDRQDFIR